MPESYSESRKARVVLFFSGAMACLFRHFYAATLERSCHPSFALAACHGECWVELVEPHVVSRQTVRIHSPVIRRPTTKNIR